MSFPVRTTGSAEPAGSPEPGGSPEPSRSAQSAKAAARQERHHKHARHDETDAQRHDRNLGELLQELRVAGVGVQILFGFLLSLPFAARFTMVNDGHRALYLASLLLAVLATALLMTPVAYHRLLFRRGMRPELVRIANAMAISGLITVGLAIAAAVMLVTGYVVGQFAAVLIGAGVICVFGICWFALPLSHRR